MWWNKKVIFEENVSLSKEYQDLRSAFARLQHDRDLAYAIVQSKEKRIRILEYQIANPSSSVKALDDEQRAKKSSVVWDHGHNEINRNR